MDLVKHEMQPVLLVQRLRQVAGEEYRGGSGESCHENKWVFADTTIPHPDIGKVLPTSRTIHVVEKPHNGSVDPTCIKTGAQRVYEYYVIVIARDWGSWGQGSKRYIPLPAAKRSLDGKGGIGSRDSGLTAD